ncbi:MAG: ribosome recycling factor, partial [Venatoribacter sp.]
MINEIQKDAQDRMQKSTAAVVEAFKRIRTGRASPAILEDVFVDYYGTQTPITQVANVIVEDGR